MSERDPARWRRWSIAAALLCVRVLLAATGYRTTARVLGLLRCLPSGARASDPNPGGIALAVEETADWLPLRTTCLVEALTAGAILARRDVATTLRVGVTKSRGTLRAHAWLVHRGTVLVGGRHETPSRYHRLTPDRAL